ncbi:hypothetical protein P280DRAFT_481549 [Massarina eburnea CBS 473.64]|uniref:HMG box domain-containing protein n=1 Tax=Massarina eburnea CBS 473.64 TaxID=1395130 RepID=A0A6A6RYY6_9PLEO|nr:hypothetical protein P280DRAFT_481549 [Massarina eburnea CBS 473.64]
MLASRVLPPISHRSTALQVQDPLPSVSIPPVATFFNIPRRYVRSNMQVADNASSHSQMEDPKSLSPRSLRKSSRIHELRSASTSSPADRSSKDDLLPSGANSLSRATRKRYASFGDDPNGTDSGGESPGDPMLPASASSTGSGELPGHVCLCQPEPKIPRPRNAFILYRQHHQHGIVARNPGLANPEISKIIGEQWKAESVNLKKVWQDLAETEKARHHEQYPDYRYQPRRLGKPGSIFVNTKGHTPTDKYRCPRCGGRSIKTPTSPFPNTPTLPTLPPPNESSGLTPTTRYLPMMSNLSLDSPATRRRGPGPGPSSLSNIQVNTATREDASMYSASPLTPSKRRRYNDYGPANSNGRRTDTPYYTNRRDSLPPIHMRNSPPGTATMPPPPRTPRDSHRNSMDLNLLVPSQHDQSRSVEAMVMSVPYTVKIKVLGRITPPLKDPGPTSPAVSVRGGIVAVEGDDVSAVKELSVWLKDFLSKDNEYNPRIEEAPRSPSDSAAGATFEEYFDLVKEWHGRSREMIKFITTPYTSSSPSTRSGSGSVSSSASDAESEKDREKEKEKSNSNDNPSITPPPPPTSPTSSRKPVIILPTYQLHASDAFASKIPITDVYSPMDHWQWMATLWRGTVGPDLTIYVKTESKEEREKGSGKVVEVNDEGKFLTVVRERDGRFAATALRRVGFEVGEWIRGLGSGG